VLRGAGQRFDELNASAGLCAAASAGPEDVLLLRLETCPLPPDGRRGIVLAGMLLWRGGELVVLQHLARRAEEETGVLSACLDALAGAAVAAVFGGGKSDVTILRRRSAEREIEAWGAFPHVLDLRREARRQWRGTLSDFRLPTLERALLGARRHGMDRGARAAACGRFIETGDARPIRDVLRNNALDLRAMAELVCLLLTGQDPTAT